MEINERIHHIEDEVKLLKAEVKAVLIDIREELVKRNSPLFADSPADYAPPPRVFEVSRSFAATSDRDVPETQPGATVPAEHHEEAGPHEPRSSGQRVNAASSHRSPALLSLLPESIATATEPRRSWGVLDMASLGKWADAACRRVGRKRLEDVLDVYELLNGQLPKGTKLAILRMADLCGLRQDPPDVAINDVVAVLTQLDGLIRTSATSEATLLSLLSDTAA